MNAFSRHAPRSRGTALVVVLIFVVLLTGLVLAFFTKSTAFRVLSQSGVSEFKVDTLGRSALDLTVADLRQEIANGSTSVNVGNRKLYLPKTPADNVPRRSGNPALSSDGIDPIPNLVRRSVRSDGISSGGVPSRASAVSSLDPAKNRKYISAARWNKHYLIPRDPAKFGGGNSAVVGTDPIPEFVAPDWVFLTTKGPEVLTEGKTNVIGRYAYAIYDEGGLLDINAAGYPESTPLKAVDTTTIPNKVWGSGNKGGSTAADLTVLGLTQSEINQIVGWRTYASSQPGGTFPNLTFDEAQAKKYFDSSQSHPYAFLEASDAVNSSSGKTKSDQIFGSRQQLLKFRSLIGFSQDALQYLGTFSRDLDQPSFVPNPNRPKVQSSELNNKATYGTGNDAFDVDREADPAQDINPPFPRVLVQKSFTRPDGTTAQIGDPLVKRRFPLSRLSKILRNSTATKDESDPIYRDFGIYRSSASDPWKYDHGLDDGILRLDKVAALGREPDFFELLKAAINVGSLAKSATLSGYNVAQTAANLQHEGYDVSSGLQLLQLGANIIDQYDADGYPTRIAFAAKMDKEIRGVESLPFLYRLRLRYAQPPAVAATPESSGYPGSVLVLPELWNPHATPPAADSPKKFRIRAESTLGPSKPSMAKIIYKTSPQTFATLPMDWSKAGELTFESSGSEFNEPVVLANSSIPQGSSLSGPTRLDTLASPQETVTGLVALDFDQRDKNGAAADDVRMGVAPDSNPITFYLEYWDGSAFQVFDQQIVRWADAAGLAPKYDVPSQKRWNVYSDKVKYIGFMRTDPRTSRWGAPGMVVFYLIDPINVGKLQFTSGWPSPDMLPYAVKYDPPTDKGFQNFSDTTYPDNDYAPFTARNRGFMQGYWSINTVQNQKGRFGIADKPYYNRDPDGIVRRAMGGYAFDSSEGGSTSNAVGLPLATGNAVSRPVILNRPFRSVAELGYTFRGTPWKNIDFSFPESGDSALLDVFCVDENKNEDALVAGKVNLNTRQIPVIQSLLTGAITNDVAVPPVSIDSTVAKNLATKLVHRTSSTEVGQGPLVNSADLIGRWTPVGASPTTPSAVDPGNYYSGFSADIGKVDGVKGTSLAFITGQRESVIRALADAGTTRTWNLMIDLVAQSGRFSADGASLASFQVQGEKRYWLHIAIDRLTGEVLDRQLEVVTE